MKKNNPIKLKILAISDIHSNDIAAQSSWMTENPDLILDCGDHSEIKNLFEITPHLYINGNHEPNIININSNSFPLPFKIPVGTIIKYEKEGIKVRIAGLDGNYSNSREGYDHNHGYNVNETQLHLLKLIPEDSVDIFLTHESPLNVPENSKHKSLAHKVLSEIERINPKLILSGHYTPNPPILKTPKEITNIFLGEISRGYYIINGQTFEYKHKISRFR